MPKSFEKQVVSLLTERGIDMDQYFLSSKTDMTVDFKGYLFVFTHRKNSEFTIQVNIDICKGKIAYYQIDI